MASVLHDANEVADATRSRILSGRRAEEIDDIEFKKKTAKG